VPYKYPDRFQGYAGALQVSSPVSAEFSSQRLGLGGAASLEDSQLAPGFWSIIVE